MNPEYGQEGTRTRKCGKKRRRNKEELNEMLVQILSRLPVKTLMVCRLVCKSWRRKISRIKRLTKSLPLDGLLLRSSNFRGTIGDHICYISLTTKTTIHMQINSPNSLVVGSSYDMGLLGNLCSEFGGLLVGNSSLSPYGLVTNIPSNTTGLLDNLCFDFDGLYDGNSSKANRFFAIHRGLLLAVDAHGTYRVHNPATKKVFVLPESPIFKEYGTNKGLLEWVGLIIKLYGPLSGLASYMVVRPCRVSKKIEVYYSFIRRRRTWKVSSFSLDDDLMNASWCWENYAFNPGSRTLCFLTNINRGVAVRLETQNDVRVYGLDLPPPVQEGFKNARIGASGGSLYISYFNIGGVWIWRHSDGGCTPTADAWIPILEISQARLRSLSCTSLVAERLCKLMDGDDAIIIPMGFHADIEVVFVRVKSLIFAYDMTNDALDEIGEMNDQVFGASTVAIPYSPCLNSLEAVKKVASPMV